MEQQQQQQHYEYKDLEGNIQGPFPLDHLRAWNRDGYLSRELEVRLVSSSSSSAFTTLGRVLDKEEVKEEVKDDEDAEEEEEEEEEEERKATTTTTTLLDERLKNVFGGIDNTTIVRDLPFAFGGSFLDKNEKDETALTTGDDEAYEGTGGEDVEEGAQEEEDLDEEVAKQNALRLLEEEEYGRDAEEETSKAKAKRNQVLEQFEDERESAKYDVDERTSFGKHPKEIPTTTTSSKGRGNEDPRLLKEATQLRKLCKQGTKALLLPTYELLMSAATRTFVMDRNDDDNVDVLDAGGDGKLQQQRPRKEYENENERDEALEEEVKNVQKGLLSKLYEGVEGKEEEEEEEEDQEKSETRRNTRRKSVEFDLRDDDARSEGERSDISWGAKMGTYEDPAQRIRAVSSSAATKTGYDDDGDRGEEAFNTRDRRSKDDDDDLEQEKVHGRRRDDDDDEEEEMKEEGRKRQRALEEEEAERKRQRQILLEKEEEENKRSKHIEFMKFLHENPTAGDWWLPNEEDGKPTLGPFQWSELSVNLPGVRVAHRYEDNRWQFVGNVNENENLIPFVPLSSGAAATASASAAADNPPELAIAKKMERENVFVPKKKIALDDEDDNEEENSSSSYDDDGNDTDRDNDEDSIRFKKESSEEGLVVEDGEVYEDGDNGDDDDENTSEEDVALLESDEDNFGFDDDDDDKGEDEEEDAKFSRYLDVENTHEWFRRSINAYADADAEELKKDGGDLSPMREEEDNYDIAEDEEGDVKRWFKTHIVEGSSCVTPLSLETVEIGSKRAANNVRFKRFENLSQISAALSAELYESIMMNKAKKKIISQLVEEVLDSL